MTLNMRIHCRWFIRTGIISFYFKMTQDLDGMNESLNITGKE